MRHQDVPMTDDEIRAAIDKLPESLQQKVWGFLRHPVQPYSGGYDVFNIINLTPERESNNQRPACQIVYQGRAWGSAPADEEQGLSHVVLSSVLKETIEA